MFYSNKFFSDFPSKCYGGGQQPQRVLRQSKQSPKAPFEVALSRAVENPSSQNIKEMLDAQEELVEDAIRLSESPELKAQVSAVAEQVIRFTDAAQAEQQRRQQSR